MMESSFGWEFHHGCNYVVKLSMNLLTCLGLFRPGNIIDLATFRT